MSLTTRAQPCRRWANLAAYPAPYRGAVPAQPAPLAEDLPTTTAKPTPPLAQHGLRQLRASGSDSGRRPAGRGYRAGDHADPGRLAVWLLAASARLTNSPGSDTADVGNARRADAGCPDARTPNWTPDTGHRAPTPDSGHPDAWTPTPDTGHRSRGHWTLTPDTGRRMLLRTGQADKARPAPEILGHHAERLPAGMPNRGPADGACGARRPMQARR